MSLRSTPSSNTPFEKNDAREVTFSALRSFGHRVFLQEMTKKMLSAYNDAVFDRYPLENRPLGHSKNIPEKFVKLLTDSPLRLAIRKLKENVA